eukprot:1696437-Pyramimonas_sp.AAC.1
MPELGLLLELGPKNYLYSAKFLRDDDHFLETRGADELDVWHANRTDIIRSAILEYLDARSWSASRAGT